MSYSNYVGLYNRASVRVKPTAQHFCGLALSELARGYEAAAPLWPRCRQCNIIQKGSITGRRSPSRFHPLRRAVFMRAFAGSTVAPTYWLRNS